MKINAAKTVLANLIDLINASNTATSLALTASQVTFADPTARTPDENLNDTEIVVTPVNGQGAGGNAVTINYKRLGLDTGVAPADLAAASQFTVAGNDAAAETALLAAIVSQLQVVDGEFFIDAGTPLSGVTQGAGAIAIDVVPTGTSKLYNGGVTIQVTWPNPPDPDLDSLIVNKDQTGFDPA